MVYSQERKSPFNDMSEPLLFFHWNFFGGNASGIESLQAGDVHKRSDSQGHPGGLFRFIRYRVLFWQNASRRCSSLTGRTHRPRYLSWFIRTSSSGCIGSGVPEPHRLGPRGTMHTDRIVQSLTRNRITRTRVIESFG